MKSKWKLAILAIALVASTCLCGCGGLNASQSISPMMFLVPGLGDVRPQPAPTGSRALGVAEAAPLVALAR